MALDAHKWAGTVAAVITVAGFLITYWQGATRVFSEFLRIVLFLWPVWAGLSVYGLYRFIRFQRELHDGIIRFSEGTVWRYSGQSREDRKMFCRIVN